MIFNRYISDKKCLKVVVIELDCLLFLISELSEITLPFSPVLVTHMDVWSCFPFYF